MRDDAFASHRWYDQDPALRQALESLRKASDRYQAQVALNIIMIIVEHQIEAQTLASVEDLVDTLQHSQHRAKGYHRRWYDVNETLRSALQLLEDTPEEVQRKLIPSISQMVENTLRGTVSPGP